MTEPLRHRHTFPPSFRLKSRKTLQAIFDLGKSQYAFPLLARYLLPDKEPAISHAQLAFSVPRKSFSKATERNRIKRRMREAFRLHCRYISPLLLQRGIAIVFVYIPKEIVGYRQIEASMQRLLKKLEKELVEAD